MFVGVLGLITKGTSSCESSTLGNRAVKSEQARQPLGASRLFYVLTVLTPANTWAEGFTDRPVV